MPLFHFHGKRPEALGVSPDGKFLAPINPKPNNVSSQADPLKDKEHYIAPLDYDEQAYTNDDSKNNNNVIQQVAKIVRAMPHTQVMECTQDYLYVEFTSGVFGFCDDVEFYDSGEGKVVHVRSASRLGTSDLGANRERIETIRKEWQQQSSETADAAEK